MWTIYAFKLAYAEDNSFELRVNTDWSCAEFVEKVTAVARVAFPSTSVTDEIHLTEGWNQLRDPNYNHIPTEENTPISLISQTLAERYHNHLTQLHFYVYFRDECQSIQLRHSRNESRTIEQVEVGVDYYYDIWMGEMRNRNINQPILPLPTGSSWRELSDRSDTIQWGWSGMNSQYRGGLTENSVAVSLDDMLMPETNQYSNENDNMMSHLPSNLLDDYINDSGLNPHLPVISNDLFPPLDRNNIYNYTNQRRPFWSIPEIIDVNPLVFMETDNIYTDTYPETSFTSQVMATGDCCICFTESTQCFTLEHCSHTVCSSCYTGVYTRVNGDVDLRCPMCRIPNSFNNNVYRQILGIDI
jgi:hypothetical protein